MNDQRKVIYEQRREIMNAEDVNATVTDMRHEVIESLVNKTIPAGTYHEQWDLDTLAAEVVGTLNLDEDIKQWADEEGVADQEILERLLEASNRRLAEKAANYGSELFRMAEKSILLQVIDQQWKEHLLALDHLRQGINLRAYAQRDPLNEYKREAFNLFDEMLESVRHTITGALSNLEIQLDNEEMSSQQNSSEDYQAREVSKGPKRLLNTASQGIDPDDPSTWGKVPRNAPCPCGSGRKYKHCHGKL